MLEVGKSGWPEITYQFVEHYFWEPQHLLHTRASIAAALKRGEKRSEAVKRGLRRQEVPLNYLLNVLLRLLPSTLCRSLLGSFQIELSDPGLQNLELKTPRDLDFIQPDVHLESDRSRVFIEVKVEAPLKRSQLEKYVRAHRELDLADQRISRAYVLLLVKRDPIRLDTQTDDGIRIFDHREAHSVISCLLPDESVITFGATTWPLFAQCLRREVESSRGRCRELNEMLDVLTADFLNDLRSRGLAY